MKHEEEPVNDYNERMKEYITDLVKQEIVGLGEEKKRDYKKEYAKYGSSTKSKKYRAELNQYNRKKGTYGNGDGKDASHKGGKIVGFEKESTNRGRAEKSRLKKENIPSPSRSTVKKMKKKGNTSVPYGSGYKKVNEFKEMSIKDAFKDLVKSQGKKKALDTLTSVLSGGMDMTPDVKKKFQKKLLKKLSESNFMEYKLKMPVNEVLPKDFFNSYKVTTRNVQKAIQIAKNMKGNMTGAVKKIEKIKKGLSDDSQVMDALRQYNESIKEGAFGKYDTGAAFKGNGMTIYDRNQSQGGDYKNIAHISEDGKLTIWDKNIKKEPKLMQSLKKISQEFKTSFKESVNEGKNIGHYERVGNQTIVDSNFVNYSKGVLPNSELVHLGMGDFAVKSPKGTIEFRRSGKLSGIGQDFVGRPHRMIDDKNGKLVDAFLKLMLKKKKAILSMSESVVNEETYFDPKGEFKKYMDKTFKRAGIKVLKFNPMKQSFHNGAWGGFYTVKSNHIGQMGATQKSDVLPIYINRVGEIELGIKAGGFHIGKAGSSQVLKNLKDFKKSDLDESYKTLTEGIKARMGEIAKQGEWEVYDPQTDKTIKVVKNSGAATRLMNRLMNSGQYEEIASRHVETHKKKFENISVTEKKGVSGSVFTIDTAKKTTELMTKVLKKVSPDIQRGQIYHSSLGGADRVSIVGKFSLDPKKTWSNNILENSRFVTFYLENDGTLEVNVNGYPFSMRGKVKMRKSANNDIKQVLSRMVTHFSMLNKKYPEGN